MEISECLDQSCEWKSAKRLPTTTELSPGHDFGLKTDALWNRSHTCEFLRPKRGSYKDCEIFIQNGPLIFYLWLISKLVTTD